MARLPQRLTLTILLGFAGLWLAIMAIALPLAALRDDRSGRVLVLFAPGLAPDDRLLAIVGAGGVPVQRLTGGFLWLAESDETGFVGRLRSAGALAAYAPDILAVLPQGGCFYVSVHPPGPPRPHPPI